MKRIIISLLLIGTLTSQAGWLDWFTPKQDSWFNWKTIGISAATFGGFAGSFYMHKNKNDSKKNLRELANKVRDDIALPLLRAHKAERELINEVKDHAPGKFYPQRTIGSTIKNSNGIENYIVLASRCSHIRQSSWHNDRSSGFSHTTVYSIKNHITDKEIKVSSQPTVIANRVFITRN